MSLRASCEEMIDIVIVRSTPVVDNAGAMMCIGLARIRVCTIQTGVE